MINVVWFGYGQHYCPCFQFSVDCEQFIISLCKASPRVTHALFSYIVTSLFAIALAWIMTERISREKAGSLIMCISICFQRTSEVTWDYFWAAVSWRYVNLLIWLWSCVFSAGGERTQYFTRGKISLDKATVKLNKFSNPSQPKKWMLMTRLKVLVVRKLAWK